MVAVRTPAGALRFGNVLLVVRYLLSLPFSNVVVERFFSVVKNVKTEKRNKLKTAMLEPFYSQKSA